MRPADIGSVRGRRRIVRGRKQSCGAGTESCGAGTESCGAGADLCGAGAESCGGRAESTWNAPQEGLQPKQAYAQLVGGVADGVGWQQRQHRVNRVPKWIRLPVAVRI